MGLFASRLGLVLALAYLLGAGWVAQDEVRHSHGGWINLRDFGTRIVTAPSQLTIGALLEAAGVPKVDYGRPGAREYALLLLHLLVTAACVYLVGWGVEWLYRRGAAPG